MCQNSTCTDPACAIPLGFCHCGCGANAPLRIRNNRRLGYRKGDPCLFIEDHYPRIKATPEATWRRFWAKVRKTEGCWLWEGPVSAGYGQWYASGRSVKPHRWLWAQVNGPIPEGLILCHRCDVPLCVRPDHLFLGTYRDNMQDAATKGRMATGTRSGAYTKPHRRPTGERNGAYTKPEQRRRGESNGHAVLTEDAVRDIRKRFTPRHGVLTALAREFGVTTTTLRAVIEFRTWLHVI